MSVRGLQTLLVMVVTDRHRQQALLEGCPTAYAGADLSEAEVTALRGLPATSLEDFARRAHYLFYGEELTAEEAPPWRPARVPAPAARRRRAALPGGPVPHPARQDSRRRG
ncbi:MAG TPA: hypothetical protein VM536_05610 [Chloroflexia bacterium]|nr:hypothetical protein [Chloroflexia bacterium]